MWFQRFLWFFLIAPGARTHWTSCSRALHRGPKVDVIWFRVSFGIYSLCGHTCVRANYAENVCQQTAGESWNIMKHMMLWLGGGRHLATTHTSGVDLPLEQVSSTIIIGWGLNNCGAAICSRVQGGKTITSRPISSGGEGLHGHSMRGNPLYKIICMLLQPRRQAYIVQSRCVSMTTPVIKYCNKNIIVMNHKIAWRHFPEYTIICGCCKNGNPYVSW